MLITRIFLISALSAAAALAAGDSAAGKAIYDKSCKMCHGPEGEGNPQIAKMTGAVMHPLASKEVQGSTDADLTKVLMEGKGKMKPAKIDAKQAADVVAFVRSLAKK